MSALPARLPFVDAARGVALWAMFVFHLVWDLAQFGWIDRDAIFAPEFRWFGHAIAASFLLLVGVSLVLREPLRPAVAERPFLAALGRHRRGRRRDQRGFLLAVPGDADLFRHLALHRARHPARPAPARSAARPDGGPWRGEPAGAEFFRLGGFRREDVLVGRAVEHHTAEQ